VLEVDLETCQVVVHRSSFKVALPFVDSGGLRLGVSRARVTQRNQLRVSRRKSEREGAS
jgi:hypothetical protein